MNTYANKAEAHHDLYASGMQHILETFSHSAVTFAIEQMLDECTIEEAAARAGYQKHDTYARAYEAAEAGMKALVPEDERESLSLRDVAIYMFDKCCNARTAIGHFGFI